MSKKESDIITWTICLSVVTIIELLIAIYFKGSYSTMNNGIKFYIKLIISFSCIVTIIMSGVLANKIVVSNKNKRKARRGGNTWYE